MNLKRDLYILNLSKDIVTPIHFFTKDYWVINSLIPTIKSRIGYSSIFMQTLLI